MFSLIMLGTTHVKEETSILQGGKRYFLLLPVSPCISDLLNLPEESVTMY